MINVRKIVSLEKFAGLETVLLKWPYLEFYNSDWGDSSGVGKIIQRSINFVEIVIS